MSPVVLLVMAKAPVPGRAKTRLTPPYTPAEAARIAAASLLDTADAVLAAHRRLGGPGPVMALDGDVAAGADAFRVGAALARFRVVAQRGDGLGERLAHAHADAARSATSSLTGRPATLQLGMDTPQATPDHLVEAARRLQDPGTDAVLGPATDGGWWLLGLRDPSAARCLTTVTMSTPRTGEDTLRALWASGQRVQLLDTLTDVDDRDSCRAVAATAPAGRFGRLVARTGVPA